MFSNSHTCHHGSRVGRNSQSRNGRCRTEASSLYIVSISSCTILRLTPARSKGTLPTMVICKFSIFNFNSLCRSPYYHWDARYRILIVWLPPQSESRSHSRISTQRVPLYTNWSFTVTLILEKSEACPACKCKCTSWLSPHMQTGSPPPSFLPLRQ